MHIQITIQLCPFRSCLASLCAGTQPKAKTNCSLPLLKHQQGPSRCLCLMLWPSAPQNRCLCCWDRTVLMLCTVLEALAYFWLLSTCLFDSMTMAWFFPQCSGRRLAHAKLTLCKMHGSTSVCQTLHAALRLDTGHPVSTSSTSRIRAKFG